MKTILLYIAICALPVVATAQGNNVQNARDFLDHLQKEQFDEAHAYFDPSISTQLPQEKLKGIWQKLNTQIGAFRRMVGIRTEARNEIELVFLSCSFERAALDMQLSFNSAGKIIGLFFVPPSSPKEEDTMESAFFIEDKFVVDNGEYKLPARLTYPKTGDNFPVVILVHGSGPNDKDESIGPNKPFRDIAHSLAEKGIATMRYDKRTKVYATHMMQYVKHLTVKEEVLDDVHAAVENVKRFSQLDTSRVFIFGHSLGGMLAPRIAQHSNKIAGIVVAAGPARRLEELILEQYNYLMGQDGIDEKEKTELAEIEKKVRLVKKRIVNHGTLSENLPLGLPASYWLDLNRYNQVKTAKKLSLPILVLQGERDYQVTMEDFTKWKKALSNKGNVTLISYPKLNHLFMPGEGKSLPVEYGKPNKVSEKMIGDLSSWILK